MILVGIFGFITNLRHYFPKMKAKEYYLILRANYYSHRLPGVVFITKNSLKNYTHFYFTYASMRIITLRTMISF